MLKILLMKCKFFLILFKKRHMVNLLGDTKLARPRVIELEDGTVSLQGFTTERANQLTSIIKGEKKEEIVVAPPKKDLKESTLGIYLGEDEKFYIASIKYDPLTKETEFNDLEFAGFTRSEAIMKLKIKMLNMKMI